MAEKRKKDIWGSGRKKAGGNAGALSVEASLLLPLIILMIFSMIVGLIFTYEKEHLRAGMVTAVYTVPWQNVRQDTVAEYLNAQDFTGGNIYGETAGEGSCEEKTASVSGRIGMKMIPGDAAETQIHVERDIPVPSEKLRRWKILDDFAEE